MKKKFLSFVLAICLLIPCAFALSACGENPPSNDLTNAQKATIYKEVALSAWSEIGIDDPTTQTTALALMSTSNIPDNKQEATEADDVLLIKMNSNNMASVLYFIGLLYENPNFAMTDGIVKFDGTASVGMEGESYEYDYTFTLKPQLDIENNKVYLESYTITNGTYEQYIVIEANYNFETKTMLSFRMCTVTGGEMYVDLGITEDNKYKVYATTNSADDFAVAINSEFISFKNAVQNIPKLNTLFSEEIQTYFTICNKVQAELGI